MTEGRAIRGRFKPSTQADSPRITNKALIERLERVLEVLERIEPKLEQNVEAQR